MNDDASAAALSCHASMVSECSCTWANHVLACDAGGGQQPTSSRQQHVAVTCEGEGGSTTICWKESVLHHCHSLCFYGICVIGVLLFCVIVVHLVSGIPYPGIHLLTRCVDG